MAKKNQEKEFHPYKIDFITSLPMWFRANFFRWWIVGIAYFFLGFGTSKAPGSYDQMISLGAIIGLLNAFLISYVIRQMSHVEDYKNPYLSIKRKGIIGTLANVALSIAILILIGFSYDGLNRIIIFIFSLEENKIYLPAEPIGFALMYLGYDFLWRFFAFRKKKNTSL